MAEDVHVRIVQETQGTAFAETEAKIKQLYQAAAKYEDRGMGDAAASARSDARALQRDMLRATVERVREEKAAASATATAAARRLAEEKAITHEVEKQALFHGRTMARGVGAGASAAGVSLGPLGGIGGIADPRALAIAAVMATVGKFAKDAMDESDAHAASQGKGAESRNRMEQVREKTGAIAQEEASEMRLENKKNLAAALAKKGSFADSGFGDLAIKGFNFAKKGLGVAGMYLPDLMTSGQKGERDNQIDIDRLKGEKAELEKLALEKFNEGPGGMQMKGQQERLAGHYQEAKAIEYKLKWQKDYDAVFNASGDRATAQRAADTNLQLESRERQQAIGTGLINARSGAGDIARAASWAGREDTLVERALSELHETVKRQHGEATANSTRENFSRPPLFAK